MVRHGRGQTHRTEVDRVAVGELRQAVLGHHPAVLQVPLARPGELDALESEAARQLGRPVEDAEALGDDLPADAVAGDDRDPMVPHRALS